VILLALILAAGSQLTLFDEVVRLPRSQWRAINVTLKQRPARVESRFQVVRGNAALRAVLMSRDDVERFRRGEEFRILAATDAGREGKLSYIVSRPDDYMVLLENTSPRSAMAQFHVGVEFNEYTSFEPRTVPPERRAAIIGVSLLVFAVIGGWSGALLLRASRRQRTQPLPPPFF